MLLTLVLLSGFPVSPSVVTALTVLVTTLLAVVSHLSCLFEININIWKQTFLSKLQTTPDFWHLPQEDCLCGEVGSAVFDSIRSVGKLQWLKIFWIIHKMSGPTEGGLVRQKPNFNPPLRVAKTPTLRFQKPWFPPPEALPDIC